MSSSGPGWTGGDGAYSTGLPNGKSLWLFGDSFHGTVEPDGSRTPGGAFVRNSLVLQTGDLLETLAVAGRPDGFLEPTHGDAWYWPADATVEGGRVRIFAARMVTTGTGAWDFHQVATDVVTLRRSDLREEGSPATVAAGGDVAWGVAVLEDDDWTYVYGVEDRGFDKYAHLARAVAGNVLGPWQYWTGQGWSSQAAASTRLFEGVSNQFSVMRRGDEYVLLSQAHTFGRDIFVMHADSPAGPWVDKTVVYTTPSWGADSYTYNAVAHPEFERNGAISVSYSLGTSDWGRLISQAELYRPRFIRVGASCLG